MQIEPQAAQSYPVLLITLYLYINNTVPYKKNIYNF
jgi:hypothetical protein